ncbi:hypothetical protein PFICI_00867 [Pestalotiopsis fici W106-1]|uniref:DUF1772-domain-containing protein n=1 Tax=Pestalotiopsis fici (strain W106-1 / CGMCC3.15140) TaxID=1229662 RepID=W3XM18_PESFW|nr:uncharacterized protein PFICI_00867 [Pestalotiopsis fici W106-1]ETS87039.1 hypothetical protein PFICI_00867 [Pestalotiopsis fici W106-1]
MAELPPHIRVTQATSIALLTTASGLNLGLSFFVAPRLLELPTPIMLQQWAKMFKTTAKALPPAFALPALLNVYLAYKLPGRTSRAYALAAVLAASVYPYTYAVIRPIAQKLLNKEEQVKALGPAVGDVLTLGEEMGIMEDNGHALIDKWAFYNLYRGGAAFVAGCVGLYAALS